MNSAQRLLFCNSFFHYFSTFHYQGISTLKFTPQLVLKSCSLYTHFYKAFIITEGKSRHLKPERINKRKIISQMHVEHHIPSHIFFIPLNPEFLEKKSHLSVLSYMFDVWYLTSVDKTKQNAN